MKPLSSPSVTPPLPLPESLELDRVPSEFADLLKPSRLFAHAASLPSARPFARIRPPRGEPLQVIHLDDARASTYALFS